MAFSQPPSEVGTTFSPHLTAEEGKPAEVDDLAD